MKILFFSFISLTLRCRCCFVLFLFFLLFIHIFFLYSLSLLACSSKKMGNKMKLQHGIQEKWMMMMMIVEEVYLPLSSCSLFVVVFVVCEWIGKICLKSSKDWKYYKNSLHHHHCLFPYAVTSTHSEKYPHVVNWKILCAIRLQFTQSSFKWKLTFFFAFPLELCVIFFAWIRIYWLLVDTENEEWEDNDLFNREKDF